MQFGTVKMWDASRGFGFIASDEDDELFVHANDLDPRCHDRELREGQRVRFDVRREMKGDRAVNVVTID